MAVTGDQIRMARAALKLSIQEVARATGVDKSTIVRAEAGGRPYYETIVKLQAFLETAGVEFLDPIENVRGVGVAFKWSKETQLRAARPGSTEQPGREGGAKAIDPQLADYWRKHPGEWAQLSEGGRRVQSEAIFGDPETASELFGAL